MEGNGGGWLADSLHAVDSNLKQLAKLAEGKDIKISNIHPGSGVESQTIASCVEELYGHYHLLAERYNQLSSEQDNNVHELVENSASPFYTPVSKFSENKSVFGTIGSDIHQSDKGIGSSSTSLSDSDLDNNGGGLDEEKRIVQNGKETLVLEILNAKLQSYEEDAEKLKSKLEDDEIRIQQLQDRLELAQTLAEKQEAHHQSEMARLLEENSRVLKIFIEQELRSKSLETEIGELNIELAKWKNTHEAENLAKGESIHILNKCVDALHLKYDMANARLETSTAELSHKDDVIQQLSQRITQLNSEKADLTVNISRLTENQNAIRQLEDHAAKLQTALWQAISDSDESSRCIDKLRSKVTELEQELEEQRVLVAEGAELKKEAIRQLCTSLEHYRSAYHELGNVVTAKKSRIESQLPSSA